MTLSTILAFMTVTALLVISPGPNGVLIAKTVPTSGKLAGFVNIAGFVTAFYIHGAFVLFGLSVILMRSAELFFLVKMIGAAYLCYIGLKALYQAWQGSIATHAVAPARSRRTLVMAYLDGLLTNALNPKVSMFYIAALPQFLPIEHTTAANVFLLVSLHSMINVVWFSTMVLVFSRLSRFASSGRVERWIKTVTGVVFIGFGLKLATIRA